MTKLASELSGCDHLGFVAKRQEDYVVDASDEKLKRWFAFLNHHMGNEGAEGKSTYFSDQILESHIRFYF